MLAFILALASHISARTIITPTAELVVHNVPPHVSERDLLNIFNHIHHRMAHMRQRREADYRGDRTDTGYFKCPYDGYRQEPSRFDGDDLPDQYQPNYDLQQLDDNRRQGYSHPQKPKSSNRRQSSNYRRRQSARRRHEYVGEDGTIYKYTPVFKYRSAKTERLKLFVPNIFG